MPPQSRWSSTPSERSSRSATCACSMNAKRSEAPPAWRAFTYVVLGLYTAFSLAPLLWVLTAAIKTPAEAQRIPPTLLPSTLHLDNFRVAFTSPAFGVRPFANSVVYALGTVFLGLLVA